VPYPRYVLENASPLSLTVPALSVQKVWRGERPQGALPLFTQADIDIVDVLSGGPATDSILAPLFHLRPRASAIDLWPATRFSDAGSTIATKLRLLTG
jgi:hypothetical protein